MPNFEHFITITHAETGEACHIRPSDAVAYVGREREAKTDLLMGCGSVFSILNSDGSPNDLGFAFGAGYDGGDGPCGVRSMAIRAIVEATNHLELHLTGDHVIHWPSGISGLKAILDFAESSRPNM